MPKKIVITYDEGETTIDDFDPSEVEALELRWERVLSGRIEFNCRVLRALPEITERKP